MQKKRFTEEQIADFLAQAKNGASNQFLCEKYNFSVSTLRRWKEKHDESIRSQLRSMEAAAARAFGCLIAVSLIISVAFSKSKGALGILLMSGYCVFYIIQFRKKSSEFVTDENIFISRSGRGARNSFYQFSWLFILFVGFVFLFALIN